MTDATNALALAQEMTETCRHWVRAKMNRCAAPAVVIVWGKLAKPDELGPKCIDHLPGWLDLSRVDQYAVFDLRPALRVIEQASDG